MADPFSSFGPEESGVRLAEQDAIKRGKAALDAMESLGNLSMLPDRQNLLKEQSRLARIRADQEQIENDAAQRLQREMMQTKLSEDPLDALYDIASAATRAGSTKEATIALQRISQGIAQQAAAERAMAGAEKAQIEGKQKLQSTFANMLGGVSDQAGLDTANRMYEQMFGEESPMKGKAYDPAEVQRWQGSTLTAKDRLNAELRRIEERGRNKARDDTARYRDELAKIRETEAVTRMNQREQAKKAGAVIPSPSDKDLQSAEKLLLQEQPGLDKEGRKLAAETIASRSKEITRTIRGVGREQADQMAYNEAVKRGDFAADNITVPDSIPLIGGRTVKQRTKLMGRKKDSPLPFPADRKYIAGRWYNTPKGVLRFTGTDFTDEEDD